ncbi:hypothetical protein, partial [Nocardia carnea]|uniref:hypothetical protein n=1 Tax=Nocardia carnea TaxID=37328 RepID=UPI0024568DEA
MNLPAVSTRAAAFAVTIAPPASYPHREAFREVAETVHIALLRLGMDSVLSGDLDLPGRRHIVFGSNTLSWWNLAVPDDAVLFNLEQISADSQWVTADLLALFRRHTVWDYSLRNIAALRDLGVAGVRPRPLGHVTEHERIPAAAPQDIDGIVGGVIAGQLAHLTHHRSRQPTTPADYAWPSCPDLTAPHRPPPPDSLS